MVRWDSSCSLISASQCSGRGARSTRERERVACWRASMDAAQQLRLKVSGAGHNIELTVDELETIGGIKTAVHGATGLHPSYQRLLIRGKAFDDDSVSLSTAGIGDRTKLMLMHSRVAQRGQSALAPTRPLTACCSWAREEHPRSYLPQCRRFPFCIPPGICTRLRGGRGHRHDRQGARRFRAGWRQGAAHASSAR